MAKTHVFEALKGAGRVYITRFAGPGGSFRIQVEAVPSRHGDGILNFGLLESKAMRDALTLHLDNRS